MQELEDSLQNRIVTMATDPAGLYDLFLIAGKNLRQRTPDNSGQNHIVLKDLRVTNPEIKLTSKPIAKTQLNG